RNAEDRCNAERCQATADFHKRFCRLKPREDDHRELIIHMTAPQVAVSQGPSTVPHVVIAGVGKIYDSPRGAVEALEDINLVLRKGEFVSLLGPSGCGKSTLLKIVAGLVPASTGEVRISGESLAGVPDGLGIVFQRDVLLDWRTILDNVL